MSAALSPTLLPRRRTAFQVVKGGASRPGFGSAKQSRPSGTKVEVHSPGHVAWLLRAFELNLISLATFGSSLKRELERSEPPSR
jgi:hypothetical protein